MHDAVGGIRCAERADPVIVADGGHRTADDIEHQLGADVEKLIVRKIAFGSAQVCGQAVGELDKRARQKADLGKSLRGDGGDGAVDHAVEFFTGRKGDLDVAFLLAALYRAAAVCKGEGCGRAVLDTQAERDGRFACQECRGLAVELAQHRQCAQHAEHVDIRHSLLVGHGSDPFVFQSS